MNKYLRKATLIGSALMLSLAILIGGCSNDDTTSPTTTDAALPGQGVTVDPARPTWDTGYFQTEIMIQALEKLGYNVTSPVSLGNSPFYEAVANGDVDFWADGWFPQHVIYMEGKESKEQIVGNLIESGALQGFMIDKATADLYNITSVAQFTDPDIAALFDIDGDGKAEMVACPPGWGCELMIDHMFEAYGLNDTVDLIKADYTLSMVDALARYQNGESIFYYGWTPNWTANSLIAGEDIVWLEVPFTSLPEEQQQFMDATYVANLVGKAGTDEPYNMGWPANSIQVVANTAFLNANPAAKYLFEVAKIPLDDVLAQNALMFDGENTNADIIKHAKAWIVANQTLFDSWIDGAIAAAK
ncbi:L-proline glycine betaine binding ABC transporter ProX [Dehalogenimonas sp. WBC-2]|nr:L-proline glycine betaine binding ABC transporter ProX [Dehalogenimonas sp. WBC-2]